MNQVKRPENHNQPPQNAYNQYGAQPGYGAQQNYGGQPNYGG